MTAWWSHHQELLLTLSLVLDLGRALVKDLILILDADILEGAFNLTLAILITFNTISRLWRFGLVILLLLHAKSSIRPKIAFNRIIILLLSLLFIFFTNTDEVLRLAIHVLARLGLVAPVAA